MSFNDTYVNMSHKKVNNQLDKRKVRKPLIYAESTYTAKFLILRNYFIGNRKYRQTHQSCTYNLYLSKLITN